MVCRNKIRETIVLQEVHGITVELVEAGRGVTFLVPGFGISYKGHQASKGGLIIQLRS